jgi:hypothetical protein
LAQQERAKHSPVETGVFIRDFAGYRSDPAYVSAALLSRAGFQGEWMDLKGARSGAVGGSVKRKIARRARNALGSLSGDRSVLVAARPRPNSLPS